MDLQQYFSKTEGIGILATCDPQGEVNQALYSKPFVIDVQTVALVMRQRISHRNLKKHLQASYMFIEAGTDYRGIRLYLTMQREETNRSLVEQLRKKQPMICSPADDSDIYVVFFKVDRIRPLVGDGSVQNDHD